MFLISTQPVEPFNPTIHHHSISAGGHPLWISSSDKVEVYRVEPNRLLLFDGVLYPGSPDSSEIAAALLAQDSAAMHRFKGLYTSALIDLQSGKLRLFNDHLGTEDLYVWRGGAQLMASNDLAALLRVLRPTQDDLDLRAQDELIVLDGPLGERTWISGLRRLPPGTIASFADGHMHTRAFWRYHLQPRPGLRESDAIEELDALLLQSARRIHHLTGWASCCLGLSGGYDSRIAARYHQLAGADLIAHFFGEREPSEGQVAVNVAQHMGIPLHCVGRNREFPRLFSASINYYPDANLEWCKYLTGRETLPPFGVLLSGRLGDQLFGGFVWTDEPASARQCAELVFERFKRVLCEPRMRERIIERLEEFFWNEGGSTASRISTFMYRTSRPMNKHCGLFHNFSRQPHFSLFADIDVVEFCLQLPPEWLYSRSFYISFIDRRWPDLSRHRLPLSDRQNRYKPLELWLRDNADFRRHAMEIVAGRGAVMPLNDEDVPLEDAIEHIDQGRYTRNQIHLFFRHLSFQAFQNTYVV